MNIPSGFGQVNWSYSGAGSPTGSEVTLGFSRGAGTSADPTVVAGQLGLIWATRVLPVQSSSLTLTNTLVKFGPNISGAMGNVAGTTVGGAAATMTPPSVNWLVRKNTGVGGREGRGRLFIPGVPEASVDSGGTIAGGSITSMNTAMAGVLTDMTAANLFPVLLHNDPTSLPFNILSFSTQAVSGSQRRRVRR